MEEYKKNNLIIDRSYGESLSSIKIELSVQDLQTLVEEFAIIRREQGLITKLVKYQNTPTKEIPIRFVAEKADQQISNLLLFIEKLVDGIEPFDSSRNKLF